MEKTNRDMALERVSSYYDPQASHDTKAIVYAILALADAVEKLVPKEEPVKWVNPAID